MSLLGSVPAHPADDVIVQDVEAGGEDGGPDEEVDGAGPKVRLAGPEAPEADGGQRHEAEVEGVVKTPVLKSTNQLKYFSPLSWYQLGLGTGYVSSEKTSFQFPFPVLCAVHCPLF